MLKRIQSICHKGCRIGYISDTHIETRNNKKAYINKLLSGENSFDVLVLAGDIGDPFCLGNYYQKFLEGCTYLADNVLLVAGNHEYYASSTRINFNPFNRYSMNQTLCKLQHMCDTINQTSAALASHRGRIHFLENSTFCYKNKETNSNIAFIGTTLWSMIDKSYETEIQKRISDYHLILGFSPELSRALFYKSQQYINDMITQVKKQGSDNGVVVITHHAPTTRAVWDPIYDTNSNLNSAFGTNFEFNSSYRPDYWIFGHTHYDCDHFNEDMRCHLLSNQVGYVSEMIDKQHNIKRNEKKLAITKNTCLDLYL